VVARISSLEIGWAKVQDIRDALLEYKKSGKPLLALLEPEASGGNKEYYLAGVADRLYLSPNASALLNGLEARFLFLGGVWDKLDIQMTVEKIREYKTAGDMIANKEMTPAHREMANSILDSVNAQFVSGLASSRAWNPTPCARSSTSARDAGGIRGAHLSNGTKYLQTCTRNSVVKPWR